MYIYIYICITRCAAESALAAPLPLASSALETGKRQEALPFSDGVFFFCNRCLLRSDRSASVYFISRYSSPCMAGPFYSARLAFSWLTTQSLEEGSPVLVLLFLLSRVLVVVSRLVSCAS